MTKSTIEKLDVSGQNPMVRRKINEIIDHINTKCMTMGEGTNDSVAYGTAGTTSQPQIEAKCCEKCGNTGWQLGGDCVSCPCHSLHPIEEEKHDTEDGYCCACDYDIAGFKSQIAESEKKERSRIVEIINKWKNEGEPTETDLTLENILKEISKLT